MASWRLKSYCKVVKLTLKVCDRGQTDMRISPKVGVLLLLTLGLCVGVQAQGRHSFWWAWMVSSTDLSHKKKYLCSKLVSQARPFPFCSADRFQYAARGSVKTIGVWNGRGLVFETSSKLPVFIIGWTSVSLGLLSAQTPYKITMLLFCWRVFFLLLTFATLLKNHLIYTYIISYWQPLNWGEPERAPH